MLTFSCRRIQYGSKITEWGFHKNIRESHMRAIARKKLTRQSGDASKASTFRLRSRPVPEQKIERYMKANGLDENAVFSDAREFDVSFLLPWLETNQSLKQLRLILFARHRAHLRFTLRARSACYQSIQSRK